MWRGKRRHCGVARVWWDGNQNRPRQGETMWPCCHHRPSERRGVRDTGQVRGARKTAPHPRHAPLHPTPHKALQQQQQAATAHRLPLHQRCRHTQQGGRQPPPRLDLQCHPGHTQRPHPTHTATQPRSAPLPPKKRGSEEAATASVVCVCLKVGGGVGVRALKG